MKASVKGQSFLNKAPSVNILIVVNCSSILLEIKKERFSGEITMVINSLKRDKVV